MPRVLASKDNLIDFSIIDSQSQQISDGMIVDQQAHQSVEFFACSTTSTVKVFTKSWELKQTLNGVFSLVRGTKDYFVTVEQSKITLWRFDQNNQLQPHSTLTSASNVSAICINQKAGILYFCQFDGPFYSVTACDLKNELAVLHSQSLSQHVNMNNMSVYFGKKAIIEDRVFSPKADLFSV